MYSKIMFMGVCLMLFGGRVKTESKPGVSVFDVMELAKPEDGELTSNVLWETANMVSHVIRITPGARIAEHYHPVFDESLIVYSGTLTVWLNGQKSRMRSGHIAYIPAGTIISGVNESDEEAIVIPTWANVGREGPLTVYSKTNKD